MENRTNTPESKEEPYIIDLMIKYQAMKIGVSERIYSATAVINIATELQDYYKAEVQSLVLYP